MKNYEKLIVKHLSTVERNYSHIKIALDGRETNVKKAPIISPIAGSWREFSLA